jgi:hypothetical protein
MQTSLGCVIKAFNYAEEGISLKLFKTPNLPPMPALVSND